MATGSLYSFSLWNPTHQVQLSELSWWTNVEWVIKDSDIGALSITLPYDSRSDVITKDCQIVIQRTLPQDTVPFIEGNTTWMVRKITQQRSPTGADTITVVAYPAIHLLDRYIIPYQEGNAYTYKLNEADDMMKAVVRENMGSLALDTTRSLASYLSIQSDTASGPILRHEFSKQSVFSSIKDIQNAAWQLGTWVGFRIDMIDTIYGGLEFSTYIDGAWNDYRLGSVHNQPILIGPEFGNLDAPVLTKDWTKEYTVIYAGGPTEAGLQPIATAIDSTRLAESPWRTEKFLNSSNSPTASELADAANAELKKALPKWVLTGSLRNLPQSIYGRHYQVGALVTIQAFGQTSDVRIQAVEVKLDQSSDSFAVTMVDV